MSVQVKHRRDTAANIAAFTPAQGELIVDTTNNRVIIGDGATVGGWPAAKLSEVAVAGRRAVADANTTATTTDRIVAYTSLTAARTVTLPAAASFPTGIILRIVDESGGCSGVNTITLQSAGTDTVNGVASFAMNGPYMSTALEGDGVSKWTLLNNETVDAFTYAGFGTAPDPSNVISAYGASALFNGTNFSFTLNKSVAANVASIIFEDNFSLRAQIGLLNSDNLSFKVSPDGTHYFAGLALDSATGAVTLGNARTAVADANYTALATDREIAYTSITAARTVALPSASAFPAGHALVVVDESGASSPTNAITIARAGSDTISGQISAKIASAYGHCRLASNGVNQWVVVGRSANVQVFSASATYTPTPGLTKADVYLIGGGGGGGGGALQAASTAVSGGGGGGGGGGAFGSFTAAQLGASQTVTIGVGGAAGAAAATNGTAGGNGGAGGNTTFGSLLTAYSGGGGGGGQLNATSGGGAGASVLGAGPSSSGVSGGSAVVGGANGGTGAVGAANTSPLGGGGGGGGGATGAPFTSNLVVSGSGGGGSGGGVTAANATANGGSSNLAAFAGTQITGGAGAGGAGVSPSLSSRPINLFFGSGGAGGASSLTAAFAGGAGGAPGGGGGGGGSAQNGGVSGAGGAGGAGYAFVVEYF